MKQSKLYSKALSLAVAIFMAGSYGLVATHAQVVTDTAGAVDTGMTAGVNYPVADGSTGTDSGTRGVTGAFSYPTADGSTNTDADTRGATNTGTAGDYPVAGGSIGN